MALQNREFTLGKELFAYTRSRAKNIFSKNFFKNQFLKIATANPKLQQQVFKFVDILPSLKNNDDIPKYLAEYLSSASSTLAFSSDTLGRIPVIKDLFRFGIKQTVYMMAETFICGSTISEAKRSIKKLTAKNQAYTLDILGELTVSELEAKKYFSEYRELIASFDKPNLSIKLSALAPQINNMDFERKKDLLKSRLRIIFREARAKNGFINIDTEHYYWKDFTFSLIQEILLEPEFKDWHGVGVVVQAYLKSSANDLRNWVSWAKKRKTPIAIRLVKGAYWDYETAHAIQQNRESPVFSCKYESDINYEELACYLLENHEHLRPAFASHNIRSLTVVLSYAEKLKIDKSKFEIQMLYGMLDELKNYFSENSYTLRVYLPYGKLLPGMAYLVRRLLENTANDSFLKQGFIDEKAEDELLADPRERGKNSQARQTATGFHNAANTDFSRVENRQKALEAIKTLRTRLSPEKIIPSLIGSNEAFSENFFLSRNPSRKEETLTKVNYSSIEDCDLALEFCQTAQSDWYSLSVEKRSACLEYAAKKLEERRFEFIALLCLEAGKPWVEADAEVSEAVDFLNYYAAQAREIFHENKLRSLTGERNTNIYQAYGTSLIVSPWNFPLAILCGMASASLVCGNAIIVKPSSQTALIAYEFLKLLRNSFKTYLGKNMDKLIHFIPGRGSEVGDYLVKHPEVRLIAFTGSNATGMNIYDTAAKARPVKKVIAEMGGKNAIIVDDTADLDEAIPGVIYSAFGYAGQKCSACSRVIILDSVYEEFLERLKLAMQEVYVAEPEYGEAYMGAQIDEAAQNSIKKYIEQGKKDGKLFFGRVAVPDFGYYVSPSIFTDLSPDSKLAQEEVFGPVLAVFKAQDLSDALRIANNSSYGLTGGLYSRSPLNIEKVITEFATGNLYINRSCTGAVVSRQAFGGLKESSLGYKAGGPNYLLNFVQEKTITENTMRRGFAGD